MSKLASAMDVKYVGDEPVLIEGCSESDLARALNWYNYVCSTDQAKEFVLVYLKSVKYDRNELKKVSKSKLPNSIGWMCRILSQGGHLPDDYEDRMWDKIKSAVKTFEPDPEEIIVDKPVISIQERVRDKTAELIGDIENQIDIFFKTGKLSFDATAWMRQKDIKPAISQKIAEYYKPLYAELFDALQGKDVELKDAYSHWKKAQLKTYIEIVKSIIIAAEGRVVIVRASRKPRKKKEKPASVIISKLKYKAEDTEYNIKSVKATDVIGSKQLWVFNAKYKTLTVYNAMGTTGLSVKGTTLTGFDEKTSIVKKLRKPKEQLIALEKAGKVNLRKFMDGIKCKPKEATGRINTDVVLVKVVK
jgi:hypothetical protein